MKRIFPIFMFLALVSAQFSCTEDNEQRIFTICDRIVIVNNNVFKNKPDDDGTGRNGFIITNAQINGDCLTVTIESAGCGGGTWEVDLVDADRISETAIVQRDLKIFLDNLEVCNMVASRTISFDLAPLRTSDKEISLNLKKWDTPLAYRY